MRPKNHDDAEAILALIAENPEDGDLYQLYGDYLQSIGDPRGELIALHGALARTPALRAREKALMAAHADAFLGPLDGLLREVGVTWRLGYLSRVTLSSRIPRTELVGLITRLVNHPSARFLTTLECGGDWLDVAPMHGVAASVIEVLAALGKPLCLRRLFLGPRLSTTIHPVLSYHTDPPDPTDPTEPYDIEPLFTAFPRLESVRLTVPARWGHLRLPTVRELELVCVPRAGGYADLVAAECPVLHSLRLGFSESPSSRDEVDAVDELARWGADGSAPELRSLELFDCPHQALDAILRSPAATRLESLVLHVSRDPGRGPDGSPEDELARAVLAHAGRLQALQRFRISGVEVASELAATLRRLLDDVAVSARLERPGPPEPPQIGRPSARDEFCCSFCDRSRREVKALIAGPSNNFICNECVELCNEILTVDMAVDEGTEDAEAPADWQYEE